MPPDDPDALSGGPAEIYERYMVPGIFGHWARELLDLAGPRPGERVLDVACGTGIVARQAGERVGRTGHVVGLDFHPGMLAQARALGLAGGLPIEWREGDAQRLPLPDGSFDLVLCHQGLQFFPDRPAALRGMRRVLALGGRLAVAVWLGLDRNPAHAALTGALERRASAEVAGLMQGAFSLGRAEELRRLLAEAGFRRIEVVHRTRPSHFPSPRAFARIVLAASVLGRSGVQLDDDQVVAIVNDVGDELEPYDGPNGVVFPMEAHLALGWREAT
jgi:ubiquinone/menaquinone biosynthesis C-methylase UbiE